MGEGPSKTEILKALAHPVRLSILEALMRGPVCVNELVLLIGRRQPYISQQLGILRRAGVVVARREGASIRYQLNPVALKDTRESVCTLCGPPGDRVTQPVVRAEAKSVSDNHAWHGMPREQIAWQPTLVAERCVGCGMCATSCGRGVYVFDYEINRPVVVAPEMCMVGCTTCATLCLYDAIGLPSRGYIRQLIRRHKALCQSKDPLRDERDRYNVARRRRLKLGA